MADAEEPLVLKENEKRRTKRKRNRGSQRNTARVIRYRKVLKAMITHVINGRGTEN